MATIGLGLPSFDRRVRILFAGTAFQLIGGFLLDLYRDGPGVFRAVAGIAGLLRAAGLVYLKKPVRPDKNTAMLYAV